MIKNNKGISAVVATVLIILITVAAVTIIWAAIIPMINGQLSTGTLCLDAVSQVSIVDEGYTCFNERRGTCDGSGDFAESACAGAFVGVTIPNATVQVTHGAKDFDLSAVQVLVGSEGTTSSYELTIGLPGVNEERVLDLALTASNDTPDSISLAPIVAVGNTQNTCGVSSEIILRACN